MLGHPGMVRRALERVVERDLEPVVPGGAEERPEVGQRAERGVDRLVPPVLVADGPRGARVVGAGLERVVAPLPEAPADRMDRRQVEHVEAHGRDVRQPLDAVAERAGPARHPALGPREQLVPCREPGQGPVHDHLELLVVPRRRGPVRIGVEDLRDLLVEEETRPAVGVARRLEVAETRLESPAVGSHDAGEGATQESGALEELARDVHAGSQALPEVLGPGPVRVRPRLERVDVPRVLVQEEPAGPAVVSEGLHARLVPRRVLHGPVAEHGGQAAVALLEDVRGHLERVADLALDGEPPPIQLGPDVTDPDAADVAARRPIGHGASPRVVLREGRGHGAPVPRRFPSRIARLWLSRAGLPATVRRSARTSGTPPRRIGGRRRLGSDVDGQGARRQRREQVLVGAVVPDGHDQRTGGGAGDDGGDEAALVDASGAPPR